MTAKDLKEELGKLPYPIRRFNVEGNVVDFELEFIWRGCEMRLPMTISLRADDDLLGCFDEVIEEQIAAQCEWLEEDAALAEALDCVDLENEAALKTLLAKHNVEWEPYHVAIRLMDVRRLPKGWRDAMT